MMTSFELVKATLNFERPDRLCIIQSHLGLDDRPAMWPKPAKGFTPSVMHEDEWGCVWGYTEVKNMGQVVGHPLTEIPSDLSATKFPDFNDDSRYEDFPGFVEKNRRAQKYTAAGLAFSLFERMHMLHGFANTLGDLLASPDTMHRLATHVVDVNLVYIENIYQRFGKSIHGITLSDDWGTQQAAFIGKDLWMEFFYPHYKRFYGAIRDCGYDIWLHSCGRVNDLIECFVKAGATVMNLQQPRAIGIDDISRRYRGTVTFETLCDIQQTLPKNDLKLIDRDVEDLMTQWASPSGGFVFGEYGMEPREYTEYMYHRFSEWSLRVYGNPLPEIPRQPNA